MFTRWHWYQALKTHTPKKKNMLIWFCTHSALFTWFHRALVHKVAAFYAEVRLASQKHDQLSQQQMGGGHGAATCVHHP